MKITKIKSLLLISLISSAIVGCQGNDENSSKQSSSSNSNISTNISSSQSSSSVKPELPTDYNISSYYEAMKILSELNNYTIKVTYMEGAYEFTNNVYFTENAIFDDYVGDEYGCLLTSEGVVRLNYYQEKLIASEVVLKEDGTPYDTVWDKTFFTSFKDINLKEFENSGNEEFFDIYGKVNKIQFMNLVHAEQTDYDKIISVTAYFGEKLSDLFFTLEFKGGFGYSIEICNINSTTIKVIDDFVAAGNGPSVICEDLVRVKELFAGFNYKRIMYYETEEGELIEAGLEYFNKDYFFTRYTEAYKQIDPASAFDTGYIGFDNKIVEGLHVNGAYYAYIMDGKATIFPTAAYHDPDITKFYNYPTYMTLFSNLHYFEKVEGKDHSYRTTNFDLSLDFVNNMQLDEVLAGLYVDGLTITLEDAELDEEAKVIFTLEYSSDGVVSGENSATVDFEFVEFGLANIMEFDMILANAIDA